MELESGMVEKNLLKWFFTWNKDWTCKWFLTFSLDIFMIMEWSLLQWLKLGGGFGKNSVSRTGIEVIDGKDS